MNIKYCSINWPYGSDGGLFVGNHIVFGRYSGHDLGAMAVAEVVAVAVAEVAIFVVKT
jgi:hypothetical protein